MSSKALSAAKSTSGIPTTPKQAIIYSFEPRTDETCRDLLAWLIPFRIGMITHNHWGSYSRKVPKDKHLSGKILIQRIETLRSHIKRLARKTICNSHSFELHEKVIKAFIENYMFY
jgi:insertion element IS1 protein InsB